MELDSVFTKLPTIETERIKLRKITLEDVEDVFLYASNEEVSKYVPWNTHKTLLDSQKFVEFILKQYEKKLILPWGIENKENGRLIGNIDLFSWQPKHKFAEISYVISKEYWGMGITTEATKEVLKFGFEKMGLVRIQAKSFIDNLASEKVMIKSGMTFEGVIRKGMYLKGQHRDLKMYSIINKEMY